MKGKLLEFQILDSNFMQFFPNFFVKFEIRIAKICFPILQIVWLKPYSADSKSAKFPILICFFAMHAMVNGNVAQNAIEKNANFSFNH